MGERGAHERMGAGSGGTTGRGPATRQWIAAALVLAAIPAGLAAGLDRLRRDVAAWVLAGLRARGRRRAARRRRPPAARRRRCGGCSGLGVGLWGGALAAIASSYDEHHRGADPERRRRAAARRPVHRRRRGGAHGGGPHVPRRQHRPHRRRHRRHRCRRRARRLPLARAARRGPPPRRRAARRSPSGVVACFLVGAAVRLAITGRVPPGRRPLHHRGRARHRRRLRPAAHDPVRPHRPRRRRRSASGSAWRRAGCWPARPCTRPRRGSASASSGGPTTSATSGSALLTLATAVRTDLRHGPAPPRRAGRRAPARRASPRSCSSSWPCGSSWSCARARPRRSAR